ncbi:MAG: metallophosphoesterase [Clostridia bacterium]|nr:metallophosphoesterase [Clostridia bacterium]
MIYITGDTHGEQARFDELATHGEPDWTENDYLIVCGDFGYIFKNSPMEHVFLNRLEKKPYTICFCDGNHENFAEINSYPVEIWNGGKVHKIRKNVIHLMRGQIYEFEGKKIFTFGGAYSRDRYMRKENYSYWREELPNDSEYKEASENLKNHNFEVDYVITHTAPREIIKRMGKNPDPHDDELTGYLEWIMYSIKFKKWFFGHWHDERSIGDKFRALLFDVEVV